MRKILFVTFLFFAIQMNCFAQSGISFIYINGSNTNDQKMKKWYENGVKKLHPFMKQAFEQHEQANKYLLKNGKFYIEEEPTTFFWGDKSQNDLTFVERDLAITKGFSPWLAFQIRKAFTHYLHDAIWVQKYHNMEPILKELHAYIKNEHQKGNKTVLFGYSAGSFVTYEYLLTRTPFVNVSDFFNTVGISEERQAFIKAHPMKNTCMAALGKELAVFSATGHIVPIDGDTKIFEKNYLHLNELTANVCTPDNSVKGIVNFASPLVLFYSDLSDPNYKLTYYNRRLLEYLIENDMFWLTVNYKEDPLGFPCGRNLTVQEIEDITNMDIEPHAGFMYDQSNTRGGRMALVAHTSYWSTRKNFSKAVVRAYVNGYNYKTDDSIRKKQKSK